MCYFEIFTFRLSCFVLLYLLNISCPSKHLKTIFVSILQKRSQLINSVLRRLQYLINKHKDLTYKERL